MGGPYSEQVTVNCCDQAGVSLVSSVINCYSYISSKDVLNQLEYLARELSIHVVSHSRGGSCNEALICRSKMRDLVIDHSPLPYSRSSFLNFWPNFKYRLMPEMYDMAANLCARMIEHFSRRLFQQLLLVPFGN